MSYYYYRGTPVYAAQVTVPVTLLPNIAEGEEGNDERHVTVKVYVNNHDDILSEYKDEILDAVKSELLREFKTVEALGEYVEDYDNASVDDVWHDGYDGPEHDD